MSMIPRAGCLIGAIVLLVGSAVACAAQTFTLEELRIPYASAGAAGLDALLVRPNEPGRYPLALINHGSPRSGADRPNMKPLSMVPQALEFARRGWAAVVVMRRGYGTSGDGWAEDFGGCNNPDYVASAASAAADLKAASTFLLRRPDIDPARMIAVGASAGGFATVALTADPPQNLVAAISFAGGRGSLEDNQVCREDRLIQAFAALGTRSRVPMLWVYADNDHFFGPKLAQKLRQAFSNGGGVVEFVHAPAFGDNGHFLFSPSGTPLWSGYVDAFLKEQNLVLRAEPVPLPVLAAPAVLGANGRAAFKDFMAGAPHKAFAVAPDGHFGWKSGMRTADAAREAAMKFCLEGAKNCAVVFVDYAPATR